MLKKRKINKGKNNFGSSGGLSVNYYKMIQMIQITQRISFRLMVREHHSARKIKHNPHAVQNLEERMNFCRKN